MDITPFLDLSPAPRILLERAAQRGDQPRYLVQDADGQWQPITWKEHADGVADVASWLASQGFEPGQRGAILAHSSPRWMEAALGLQAAGLAMVPVYPASTPDQAAYVIEHSATAVLFVAEAGPIVGNPIFLAKFAAIGIALVNIVLFHRGRFRDIASWRTVPASARLAAVVSLAAWTIAAICGRYAAYA